MHADAVRAAVRLKGGRVRGWVGGWEGGRVELRRERRCEGGKEVRTREVGGEGMKEEEDSAERGNARRWRESLFRPVLSTRINKF